MQAERDTSESVSSTAPGAVRQDGVDPVALKTALLAAVGQKRVVLSTCLERSGAWTIEGDKLVIPCLNGYDAGAVLAETGLLAKKVLEIAGRSLRIEPRAAEVAPRQAPVARSDDDDDSDDGDDGPADPVGIVEKVFRGKRSGGSRPLSSKGEPLAETERSESWT